MEHGLFALPFRPPSTSASSPTTLFIRFRLLQTSNGVCGCGVLNRATKARLDASSAPLTAAEHEVALSNAPIDEVSRQALGLFEIRDRLEAMICGTAESISVWYLVLWM
jgi:hypothetical protein